MRRSERDRRGPWYLLTGLMIGAALGVVYAWVGQPVKYTDTKPSSLRAEFKDQYRALIASAYMANGDLLRARARLDLLQDADVYTVLAEQAQRTLAGGGTVNINEARALGVLAVAIGQPSSQAAPSAPPAADTPSPSPLPALSNTITVTVTQIVESPTPTGPTLTPSVTRPGPTRTASITPLPTRTFTPTPGSPFALQSEELSCPVASPVGTPGTEQPAEPLQAEPLIVVQAYDAAGQGVPGVQVIVNWDGGESRFSTGLKPELGLGYADFSLVPGVVYTLRLAEGGQIIPDLVASECQADDGSRFWGSWVLIFKQP